jgi:hypothetical protein
MVIAAMRQRASTCRRIKESFQMLDPPPAIILPTNGVVELVTLTWHYFHVMHRLQQRQYEPNFAASWWQSSLCPSPSLLPFDCITMDNLWDIARSLIWQDAQHQLLETVLHDVLGLLQQSIVAYTMLLVCLVDPKGLTQRRNGLGNEVSRAKGVQGTIRRL